VAPGQGRNESPDQMNRRYLSGALDTCSRAVGLRILQLIRTHRQGRLRTPGWQFTNHPGKRRSRPRRPAHRTGSGCSPKPQPAKTRGRSIFRLLIRVAGLIHLIQYKHHRWRRHVAPTQQLNRNPGADDSGRNRHFNTHYADSSELGLIALLNPRIPSAKPFPSSGNFFGPNRNNATARITSRCRGWSMPSII
jgi:hypothetical protein